jgi:hypothetical protein
MASKNPDISTINPGQSFFYENGFYLTARPGRIAKFLTHYELFKVSADVPGDIVECGVFKGASFSRFAKFRMIFKKNTPKKIVGFDVFGKFPVPDRNGVQGDIRGREVFVRESGEQSITRKKLMEFLKKSGASENIELVAGDVSKTIPAYIDRNPGFRISLLNVDVDLYKPTLDCLAHLYDRVCRGGVIILDDYKGFPGATKAIDEFFSRRAGITIRKMDWAVSPFFVIKP